MTLSTIITPMNFTLVRDAVCQLLANERDAQKELARKSNADENWISETLDFIIFPKRFRYPDVSKMPCVFIYFDEADFPEDGQDIYENYCHGNLQIDYYAVGKTEIGINDKKEDVIIRTADENAEDRLNYLTAQIYKVFCSENNITKATKRLVTRQRVKKWKRIIAPEDENPAVTVLGASYSFELGFNEPTYYAKTTEIKEFYTTLKIREEFIDPLIKIILNTKNKGD